MNVQCKRCSRNIPDTSVYCMYCGRKQDVQRKQRLANGMGTAYKRGRTWTVKVIVGWRTREEDNKRVPIARYKSGFRTRKDAMAYAPSLMSKPVIRSDTFYEIYQRWEPAYAERITTVTMAGYQAAFKHFKPIHHQKICDITAHMLQQCINACRQGKRTKQNMKVIAGLLMKFAIDDRQITVNAAANLYTGSDPVTPRAAITEDELARIAASFDVEPFAKYVYAMCYLGFRPTEFLNLRKSDYHVAGDTRFLTAGIKTNAGRNRPVTIPPKIQPIIDERLAIPGTDYLFPRQTEAGDYVCMTEAYFRDNVFAPLMKRLGIKDRTPYSTRHTYANKIKRAAGADRDKADLMGHTDYGLTERLYQSTDLSDRKAITDQL